VPLPLNWPNNVYFAPLLGFWVKKDFSKTEFTLRQPCFISLKVESRKNGQILQAITPLFHKLWNLIRRRTLFIPICSLDLLWNSSTLCLWLEIRNTSY